LLEPVLQLLQRRASAAGGAGAIVEYFLPQHTIFRPGLPSRARNAGPATALRTLLVRNTPVPAGLGSEKPLK
jgi:hypothetical protein